MPNLKQILMMLGNRLVLEYGYNPAAIHDSDNMQTNTVPIKEFTDFLNNSPEARAILRELGLNWSIDRFATAATIETNRRNVAEKLFVEHDFEPDVVEDTGNWDVSGDTHTFVYFLENGDKPSRRCEFSVTFRFNSTQVVEVNPGGIK